MYHSRILLLFVLVVSETASRSPNIVFILTDDLDVALGGLTPLKQTKNLIADEGVTFTNAFVTTPICCPSRSSILTGLYLHSHGTVNNSLSGGCNSHRWRSNLEERTFANVLHSSGYQTFYAGKYLNKYGHDHAGGVSHVPQGWDWWVGLVGNSRYYNYTLSVNGSGVDRGDKDSDYLTDVLKEYSLEFLKSAREPFLMVITPPAPHDPFTPAARHKGKFSGMKAPRTPNFNKPADRTKHWLLRHPPEVLPEAVVERIDEVFRNRWETLLSVDELVENVIGKLKELKVLDNTFLIFSSDHGFHLGQFGLPWDKRQPYETDIRIPMLIRGPGIFKRNIDDIVLNIDLASTILNMAGVSSEGFGDGKSFLPLINSVSGIKAPRSFLIEYRGEGNGGRVSPDECNEGPDTKLCLTETCCKCFDARNNTFDCIRRLNEDVDDVFCEFQDEESFQELYDMRKDPFQIENLAAIVDAKQQKKILDCCRKMMASKKAVDECFDL